MDTAFFDETKIAYDRITELYDLIHPIIISFANFKKEIVELINNCPDITEDEIKKRYRLPNVRSTETGYVKIFLDEKVETFESKVSWLLLTNTFSIYEGWLETLINGPFSRLSNQDSVKNLQFPRSIKSEITRLKENESGIMTRCFLPTLMNNTHYTNTDIKDLMKCYRFFKELRNSNVHGDGKVTQTVIDKYNDFIVIKDNIIIESTFLVPAPVLGEKYDLLLDDVIAFSNVILDLIVVLDAELTCSNVAEQIFLEKFRSREKNLDLNSNPDKAADQCARMARMAGIRVYPSNRIDFMNYLKSKRLVF